MLVGSSPVSTHNKWSGHAFKRPSFTMISKYNSWKSISQWHIFPPTQDYSPGISMWNDYLTSLNVLPIDSDKTFLMHRPSPILLSRSLCNFFPPMKPCDLQNKLYDQLLLFMALPRQILMQPMMHQHGHAIPPSIPERPKLVQWPFSSWECWDSLNT